MFGRAREQAVIDQLLAAARDGVSSALVIRGEPGLGKTALLDYAAATTTSVLRGSGFASEAGLPFAALHLLLGPVMGHLPAIPEPQRAALRGAFGLAEPGTGDRFLVGLAVLSLLSEAASGRPLLCLVDDAHWLDRASADALLFAGRRLDAEGIVMLFAARDGEFPGLAELRPAPLTDEDASRLLAAHGQAPTARLLAEASGNPLALIELPALLAGHTDDAPLSDRLLQAFAGRVQQLPEASQTALLVAAAEEVGDLDVISAAARLLGVGLDDLRAAEETGLVHLAAGALTFRHPLIRTAVYRSAPHSRRLATHDAIARVVTEEDRRALHRAAATTGRDEAVAGEVERAAVRAGQRDGHAERAAAYERAAALSEDPQARTRRRVLAAQAAAESGDLTRARTLTELVQREDPDHPLTGPLAAAAFARGDLHAAHRLLVRGGEPVHLMAAADIAWLSGDRELAEDTAARLDALDATDPLIGLMGWVACPTSRKLPALEDAVAAAGRHGVEPQQATVWACSAGLIAARDKETLALAAPLAARARADGRIGLLPQLLHTVAATELHLGRHAEAGSTLHEEIAIAGAIGQEYWVGHGNGLLAYLAAIGGDEDACRSHADAARASATTPSTAPGLVRAQWALGLLDLGHGRVVTALARLDALVADPKLPRTRTTRGQPDLIEAAVRLGRVEIASRALDSLTELADALDQPFYHALVERSRALLSPTNARFAEALRLHERAGRPFEAARTQLLYGEWLRRERHKAQARVHLATALETFDRLGARPWADRARTELTATGAPTAQPVAPPSSPGLTPQESRIVGLAALGLSNRDIAAQLFLSPRTVSHHLYKAYPKLGVTSRAELAGLDLLPGNPQHGA